MSRLLVLQHLDREGPGLFSQVAVERGMTLSISRLDLGEVFPEPISRDVILIMGGPMGVHDIKNPAYPWLVRELEFIKKALNQQIPIIGVCLGAQLLAYAAGGNVEPLLGLSKTKQLPEVGWAPITLEIGKQYDFFHSNFEFPIDVLHWHGDRILLPPNAELIASSLRCKEQFFRIAPLAYGLQFHVEIEDEMVHQWIDQDHKFIRSALGFTAQEVLLKQQRDFGQRTRQTRLRFLRTLFKYIEFSRKTENLS